MLPTGLKLQLEELKEKGTYRALSLPQGIDFSSNDYLGFAHALELRKRILGRLVNEFEGPSASIGSTGSRLLRGNSRIFEETENLLAKFSGREAAVLFPSGYQANLGLLSAILTAEDLVFSDELNHASLIDGIRLGRARKVIYAHANLNDLESRLKASMNDPVRVRWIVTESLFSMDGDQAPIAELVALAEKYRASLIVDEAHATGLWGAGSDGGGLVQSLGLSSRVFATLHTGGKALGTGGAWIAGDASLKEFLVNFSRPLIFSTAPIPVLPLMLQEAIGYWRQFGREAAEEVFRKSKLLRFRIQNLLGQGPILPLIIGDNLKAVSLASRLREEGFDVRAIRPPTVASGTARLRITCHADQLESDCEHFADRLKSHLQSLRTGVSIHD